MLSTRILSAIIAAVIVALLYATFEVDGLKILVAIGAVMSAYEMMRILFASSISQPFQWLFFVFATGIFALCSTYEAHAAALFAFMTILYCFCGLFLQKEFNQLDQLQAFISKSVLGFFYVGLLPSFAFQLLSQPDGVSWFFAMLAIVFAGDIGAYAFGVSFGKNKLMPKISPKKTMEGAFGGLVFSVLTGLVFLYWLPLVPAYMMIALCLLSALVAQMGDLFESLLKRVAEVKDSGKIFPGHGGILDRIDGILFACPVFLLGVHFLTHV